MSSPTKLSGTPLHLIDGSSATCFNDSNLLDIFTMALPDDATRSFPYDIQRQVGQGAMGEVYLARETNLGRKVAIKTLRPDFLDGLEDNAAREASHRFLQEARAIARVSHRHIVSVYRLGTEQGTAFIAMEWLDGQTLEELIDQNAPLAPEDAVRWTIELLEALGAAHHHDIVHRDVKPANVMIGPDGHIKLTDFGVAQVRQSSLVETQAGSMIGTPLYAAPEQLSDSRVDRRADLYSTGVMLYEMLAGEVPFFDSNVVKLIQKITNEAPPALRDHNPDIPPSIGDVVSTALRKTPERRFDAAESMARSLFEALPSDTDSMAGNSSIAIATTASTRSSSIDTAEAISVAGNSAPELVARTVINWEPDAIGTTNTDELLEKLLETPVHADPFCGALRSDDHLFLIAGGLIYGTIDMRSGATGDAVYETRPDEARATLFALPERRPHRSIAALSSLLHPPEREHERLDTSFTDMQSLYQRLCREGFNGAVRLEGDDQGLGFLLLDQGEPLLDIFSKHWGQAPLNKGWPTWMEDRHLVAHVERRRTLLSQATYRRELSDLEITVGPNNSGAADTATAGELELSPGSGEQRSGRATTVWRDIYESDISYQLLRWLRDDLSDYLDERGRRDGWKYLAGWIDDITSARLYHHLERPGHSETDYFDLVTADQHSKVLHLARRVAVGTVARLNAFIDDVEAAKKARIKTGDIGGAILVADDFDEEAMSAYLQRVEREDSSWFFSFQESMTGYQGFVRMGTRRGFHLLLVERGGEAFKPLLPPQQSG